MSHFTVRHFVGSDLSHVVAVWNRALRRDPIDAGRFTSWLLGDPDYWPGPHSGMFVADRDSQLVGFVRAIVRRWPNDRVGMEPEHGWIPVLAVDPDHQRSGIGRMLLDKAVTYLREQERKHVWVCGNTGSAPGYVFPGVDKDAYAGALQLFKRAGFVVDHEPVAMSREVVDFDVDKFYAEAWAAGGNLIVETLAPQRVQDFLIFMAESFPGDWNIVARHYVRAGRLGDILIARRADDILGYCQWDGEHFGPFGVRTSERGTRIGAKLFVEAVRRIREGDGRTVWFNWADPDAARFYGRFGLTATRRFAILRLDL